VSEPYTGLLGYEPDSRELLGTRSGPSIERGDGPGGRGEQPDDEMQRRGLAGAVRSYETDNATLAD
jgi:hypothetical protein